MSAESMVRYCSPTLAGLKTGSLLSCPYANREEMHGQLRQWNLLLGRKGLRVLPLRFSGSRGLVYVYRSSRLCRDLDCRAAQELLLDRGYPAGHPSRCIAHLAARLGEGEGFPHEIGLFIGYPPEDVRGFIEQGAAACKCCGCWKVYGDVDAAQKVFAKHRKCTSTYCRLLAQGRSIEQLTVADLI